MTQPVGCPASLKPQIGLHDTDASSMPFLQQLISWPSVKVATHVRGQQRMKNPRDRCTYLQKFHRNHQEDITNQRRCRADQSLVMGRCEGRRQRESRTGDHWPPLEPQGHRELLTAGVRQRARLPCTAFLSSVAEATGEHAFDARPKRCPPSALPIFNLSKGQTPSA
jgi:hypothetical protein